jgi:hypothetical protein
MRNYTSITTINLKCIWKMEERKRNKSKKINKYIKCWQNKKNDHHRDWTQELRISHAMAYHCRQGGVQIRISIQNFFFSSHAYVYSMLKFDTFLHLSAIFNAFQSFLEFLMGIWAKDQSLSINPPSPPCLHSQRLKPYLFNPTPPCSLLAAAASLPLPPTSCLRLFSPSPPSGPPPPPPLPNGGA